MFRPFLAMVLTLLPSAVVGDTVYVSRGGQDIFNRSVIQIDSIGNVSTYLAGVTAPSGLAFDSNGDLYLSNSYQSEIVKYAAGGGSSIFTNLGLHTPFEIAFDQNGTLWVANQGNGTVSRVLPNGNVNTAGVFLGWPTGIAIDSTGNVFVGSYFEEKIYKIVPNDGINTTVTTFATGVPTPHGLAIDGDDNLYAAGFAAGVISKISPLGDVSEFATGIHHVQGLDIGSDGILYATSEANDGSVVKVLPDGTVVPFVSDLGSIGYLTVVVPEPSTIGLCVMGSILIAPIAVRCRRQRVGSVAF